MLFELTFDNKFAHSRVLANNSIRNSGMLAWNNMKRFYAEEDQLYKTEILARCINIQPANNLNDLQSKLDAWLLNLEKAQKYDFAPTLTEELKMVCIRKLIEKLDLYQTVINLSLIHI